jgi:hypothetical protein
MKSQLTKTHTFASRTSQYSDQSLQKSVLFSNPRRNLIIFSPTLRSFIFFTTAKPDWDKQPNRLLSTYTGQRNIKRTKEARSGNMGLASCGVKCLNSSVVFQINFSAGLTVLCSEIPHERQAQNR